MTEPKAPSFNGVGIRVGDEVEMKIGRVRQTNSSGTLGLLVEYPSGHSDWAPIEDVAKIIPATRPLVPGPAILGNDEAATVRVIAIEGDQAWVVSAYHYATVPVSRLRNTEGTAS